MIRRLPGRKRPFPFLLTIAVVVLLSAGVAYGLGVRFTLTPSVPRGFYLYGDEAPEVGRFATFCPPEAAARYALARGYLHRGACTGGVEPLGKFILAGPGDTVIVRPEGLSARGRAVPNSALYLKDRMGRDVPHYGFGMHVVGRDSFFMFSPYHARSFDSRYFGPVPRSSLISTARPLWTFD